MKGLTICSWIWWQSSLAVAGVIGFFQTSLRLRAPRNVVFISVLAGTASSGDRHSSRCIFVASITIHQIQLSLALIEEHLKKMSQKD
jgi:hypothetical protein